MSHHDARSSGKRKSRDRRRDLLERGQRFLIVCEGERTEPAYFKAFRAPREVCMVDIRGEGYNTLSLVKRTIELNENAQNPYDQVWCVFDRDSFPIETFNQALALADGRGFHVAYSNEAFELWYLLHFNYLETGITRQSYCQRLDAEIGRKYRKNDPDMYEQLRTRQPEAIRNAKKLLAQYYPTNPASDNPSTTVFKLVEELNKFLIETRVQILAQ